MKKYLFGLGAMLIGAGLMFVFTHTEVSADSKDKKHLDCQPMKYRSGAKSLYEYCHIKDLTCVSTDRGGISCVKAD